MQDSVDKWIKYHGTAYGGFGKWVADNPAQVKFMRRLLEAFSIEQLSSATDRLYASDEQPRGYGEHARKIRQLIVEAGGVGSRDDQPLGPLVVDGHLTAHCTRCMDYGVVSVLSPATIKRLRTNDSNHAVLTCGIACDCSKGNLHARKLPRWQSGYMLIRYEDVLDGMAERHMDMWDVARELVSGCVARPVEFTGAELP